MKVSVLLLTYNEEKNIGACLNSLDWCDDVLIVDSGSTDGTVAIAESCGARIVTRPFDNFAKQRNHGLEVGELRHEWVLHLDADEMSTPAFHAAIEDLSPPDEIDAYRVPSKLMFMGRWLRRAGAWPVYQVRLGRRDSLRFKQVGHGQQEDLPPERVATFHEPYLHYSFSHGLRPWLQKHVRYADDEAKMIVRQRRGETAPVAEGDDATARRRRFKALVGRLPLGLRPVARFGYSYVLRGGWRDGAPGFMYALMMSVYEGMIAILAFEQLSESGGVRDGERRRNGG